MRLHWFVSSRARTSPAGRLLTKRAPSWAASPFRRSLQTGFFLLFGWLFFFVAWPYGSVNYSQFLRSKEILDAEWFLAIDPLVSASAALAGRMAVWSLAWGAGMLAICLVLPRFFCGYACPLGTLIDLFDGAVNRPLRRLFHAPGARGAASATRAGTGSCWRHFRYFLLIGILAAGAGGVLLSGWFAPIPIITRGFQCTFSLAELGLRRGWHQVPPLGLEYGLSIALFASVLLLGLIRPRFWCRYVCPSGAMFSLVNRLALTRRHVTADCTGCGLCRKACSFDAVDADFATRVEECAFCQTCGGVCPVGAIRFAGKGANVSNGLPIAAEGVTLTETPTGSSRAGKVSRRGVLSGVAAGSVAGIAGATGLRWLSPALAEPPVRPPGSVPEREFLRLCVRCGECFRACPNNVLQPMGPTAGLDNLWTPAVVADWSGCEPTCNNCGQVCPTGAIRALSLEDKRVTRIAIAVVNEQTCLQCLGQGDCQTVGRDGHPSLLCRDECEAAGYHAIDLMRLGVETDAAGLPVEGSGYLAPKVAEEKCIGCGLCQTRCYKMNAKQKRLLAASAIRVVAGDGNEDRLLHGSIPGGRARNAQPGPPTRPAQTGPSDYITDF